MSVLQKRKEKKAAYFCSAANAPPLVWMERITVRGVGYRRGGR